MNRINQVFKKSNDILSIYFTSGFPKLDDTIEIIKQLDINNSSTSTTIIVTLLLTQEQFDVLFYNHD